MTETLFRGGYLVDGSGVEGAQGDVLVRDGVIVDVGRVGRQSPDRIVECGDLVVCPGFIDMHAHSDLQVMGGERHMGKIRQGITTEVVGQDGLSYAPVRDAQMLNELRAQIVAWNGDPDLDFSWRRVSEYLDVLAGRIRTNVAFLIGHGTLRMNVAGHDPEPLRPHQTETMLALAGQGMDDGAVGVSLGLTYVPGTFGSIDELVDLCRVVAARGGYLSPHHRDYGARAMEGYAECVEIARRTGIRLHLTHAVMNFPPNAGRAGELLDMLDDARGDGVVITLDSYPYTAGNTYLAAFLPSWAYRADHDDLRGVLREPSARARIRHEMETGSSHRVPVDWTAIVVSGGHHPEVRDFSGRSITRIAADLGQDPFGAYCHLLELDGTRTSCLNFVGYEDNVQAIMRSPFHMIGTDAILVGDRPHPRGWGAVPRFLGRYVRELGLVELVEAVRKLTSLPASVIGLTDRGILRPGYRADVVCFDPESVVDRATYEEPMLSPVGIEHVMVNGEFVVRDDDPSGRTPGEVLTTGANSYREVV